MYGHYLQKKKQNITVQCVATPMLRRDHCAFMEEIEKRWSELEKKRTLKTTFMATEGKRQKALASDCASFGVEDTGFTGSEEVLGGSTASPGSAISNIGWGMKSSKEKMLIREEVQTAWDLAFAVCGIKFQTANNPAFRDALLKTRVCPDFRIACSQTMSTTRLDKLNKSSNLFKEQRLKAGMRHGFLITSDGWRSVSKRQYHNFILVSVEGPIFLGLVEVTGHGGTGQDIKDQFEEQYKLLGNDLVQRIIIGVTDTPSANRKAWKLLETAHPKQFWIGCAAHEVSLLFKEWVKKVPDILALFKEGHRIVKWVKNHSEILKLYRTIVSTRFTDKRKHGLSLYSPGDTRMLTVFKMLHRIVILWEVLHDMVGRPEYDIASQKALKAWSDAQTVDKRLTPINGKYADLVKHSLQSNQFKARAHNFVQCSKSALFLHRLVDGQSPVLGKFYYSCALVDKHLRVIKESSAVIPYIDSMRTIFAKRWKRWHQPIHTFAYAVDPCYQEHELTREERADCNTVRGDGGPIVAYACLTAQEPLSSQVIKKLGGAKWADLKIEFDRWRAAGRSIFPDEVWKAADKYHGYHWWASFGDDFELLSKHASDVLAQAISASACEFNWSDVGQVCGCRH